MAWLNRSERYFALYGTPKNQRVQCASFYLLDDAQLWYHLLELNGGLPSWHHFVQLVHTRFGLPLIESPIGEFALLRRDTTVEAFCNRFMALDCCDSDIAKAHQIHLFMAGLGQPMRTDVVLQKPSTLDEAIMYAHAYEQCTTIVAAPRASGCSTSKPPWPTMSPFRAVSAAGSTSSAGSVNQSVVKKFTLAEIVDRCSKGLCLKCDEKFVPSHRDAYKCLFCIELIDEDDHSAEPTISLAALTGIKPLSPATRCMSRSMSATSP
jgi:hypothetical protein